MTGLALHADDLDLQLRDPFTISRGTSEVVRNVRVRLLHGSGLNDALVGWGKPLPIRITAIDVPASGRFYGTSRRPRAMDFLPSRMPPGRFPRWIPYISI